MLVSQYADDTTLFLDEDLNRSNYYTVTILKWFERISGLALYNEKTEVVKIGASRGRSISWQGKYGFEWTNTFEILRICYNIDDIEDILKTNIFRKMGEVKTLPCEGLGQRRTRRQALRQEHFNDTKNDIH